MTTPPGIVMAPWSPDQVASLTGFQHSGAFHPFTCSGGGGPHSDYGTRSSVLVADENGWRCPVDGCMHRQDWAHGFMADWSWKPGADAVRNLLSGGPAVSGPAATMRSCECADGTGWDGCPAPAKWLVRPGREIEQAACARHLARVCDALSRDQGERVVLSLIPIAQEVQS